MSIVALHTTLAVLKFFKNVDDTILIIYSLMSIVSLETNIWPLSKLLWVAVKHVKTLLSSLVKRRDACY